MSERQFVFKPAVRENTPMIIGISGASGSGKTYTALELAMGLAGKGKVAFIDTEGRRGLHYADLGPFQFDHLDFQAPYQPRRFLEALKQAAAAGYAVVIVDSFSDEYVGEGGLVDMANAELPRVKNTAAAWAMPKAEHKLVVRWLRQSRCHVIFCLRAEEKVRLEKVMRKGKEQTVVVPIGWQPVCEKNVPYEMTTSFLLTPDQPGVPKPIKIQEQHRAFFPLDRPITRKTGERLAAWCAGGAPPPDIGKVDGVPQQKGGGEYYTQAEVDQIGDLSDPRGSNVYERRDGNWVTGPPDISFDPDDPFGFGAYSDPDPVLNDGLPLRLNNPPGPSGPFPTKPIEPDGTRTQPIPLDLPAGMGWPGFAQLVSACLPTYDATEIKTLRNILAKHPFKEAAPGLYIKVIGDIVDRERELAR